MPKPIDTPFDFSHDASYTIVLTSPTSAQYAAARPAALIRILNIVIGLWNFAGKERVDDPVVIVEFQAKLLDADLKINRECYGPGGFGGCNCRLS